MPIYGNRNNNDRNNNKKKYNWFTKQIDQKGKDFMSQLSKQQISNDALSIIRDMVYGRIDYNEFGQYFYYKDFLIILIEKSIDRQRYYSCNLEALRMYLSCVAQGMIYMDNESRLYMQNTRDENFNLYTIYNTVLNALVLCLNTNTIDPLLTINSNLKTALQMVKL